MLRYGVLCYKYKILLYLCTFIIYRPFGNKKKYETETMDNCCHHNNGININELWHN